MTPQRAFARFFLLALRSLCWLTLACTSASALADPPERVARLSYASGAVSFSPAGEDQWVDAVLNRPFVTGDRLWTDTQSRAELQIGNATLHVGATTSLAILNLDDRIAQFQLTQGSLNLHVRQVVADEIVEVDTPNLAFTVRDPGEYRIDVDANGESTAVAVQSGYAEVYGEGASYAIDAGQWYRFYGDDLGQREFASNPPRDELDRWSYARDQRQDASRSLRYLSPQVIGYADLDDYGTWQSVQGYGNVWMPTQVAPDWAPYRQGHWAWIEPWGWNWVDDEPWGFAPFHYGRWAWFSNRWGWVPGPATLRPVYAPALVVFAGGDDFRLTVSGGRAAPGIAWFPLAPGEVYRPSYRVSRDYFTRVNVSNTRVDRGSVSNLYDSYNDRERGRDRSPPAVNYANRQAPGAITAVPQNVFAGSQSISRAAVPVARETLPRLQPLVVAPVAPAPGAVLGASTSTRDRPPGGVLTRPVIARQAPPAPLSSFATRQPGLGAQPGRAPESAPSPIKPAERSAATWPQVRVVGGGSPLRVPPLQGGTQVVPQAPNATSPARANANAAGRAAGVVPQPATRALTVPPLTPPQRVAPPTSPASPSPRLVQPERAAPLGRPAPPALAQPSPPAPQPSLAPPAQPAAPMPSVQPLARPPEALRLQPAPAPAIVQRPAPAVVRPAVPAILPAPAPAVVPQPEPMRVVPAPLPVPPTSTAPTPGVAPLPVPAPGAAPQELRRGELRPPARAPGALRGPDEEKR